MNLSQIKRINRWRDGFNPLRGLTMMQAVSLLEAGERGEYASLQWLYRAVERRNATLRAVKSRRVSALTRLDWNVKTITSSGTAQATVLRSAYEQLDNLREAIGFLALAEFRGYAHLEKHRNDNGNVVHFEPVPQWLLFRQGLNGAWQYNPDARNGAATDDDPFIEPDDFLIREVDDPINEIAVIAHLRQSLSQKDWDSFVETYGIPPLFIELPPNIPADKEALYQAQAEAVIGDSRGTMPNGAKVQTIDCGARGTNPFNEHIRYQDECIVLAGTGGILTMLTESGSGTLAGNAHEDTFDQIARADALAISEVFQKQFDAAILAEHFPGAPVLAYFELAAKE
jgi:phage gp29-like protein